MIKENQVAERIAIDSYRESIRYLGDKDPTTRRLLETVLPLKRGMRIIWQICCR